MSSPLNDPSVDQWFQQFNAPLKRLPAEERAQLHTEVRQHLEALVVANEELGSSPEEAWAHALEQFGNPKTIGRRLAWEWRRKKGVVSPDMAAVLYGLGAHLASTALLFLGTLLVMRALRLYDNTGAAATWEYLIVVPLLTGTAIGWRFPRRAITGAFYATFAWPIMPMVIIAASSAMHFAPAVSPADLFVVALWPLMWLTLGCGAAYLASARKRQQWYRPRWADLKLEWPTHADLRKQVRW